MKRLIASLAALGVVVLMALPAQASGAGAVSITQTFHDLTQSFPVSFPCIGETGTVTITENGVMHLTVLANGTGWFTFTGTGDFSFVPDAPGTVSFTGHFTIWDGDNFNLNNGVATHIFVIHGTGSDGSTVDFHDVAHVNVNSSGQVTLFFDKPTCG